MSNPSAPAAPPAPTTPPAPNPSTSTPAQIAAAKFIRDLFYDPVLRDAYYDALNKPRDNMRASALDTLLKNNGYACTHTDLGDGWKALTSQSLLAWQSIYQLHPSSTAANADPTIHTCVVMGSRNGKSMIVLDGVNIIGYTDNFVKDGTLSWSTESSNAPLNGIISFEHKVVGDATNIGSRVMNAKLWKKGDPTPDAITHSGHDFFDDVSKFDGTYNTSLIDPVYGDESTGPQIQVAVNVAASAVNSATIDLNVNSDSGTPITVATNLAADQNTVQWSNQNNVNVTWPDADTATWAQGYMNFSWNYKPSVQQSDGTMSQAKMLQGMNGSIWLDTLQNSVDVTGDYVPPAGSSDISDNTAVIIGAIASTGLFLLIGVGLFISFKKLVGWISKLFQNNETTAKGLVPSDKDQAEQDGAIRDAQTAEKTLDQSAQEQVVDRLDPSTFIREKNAEGDEFESFDGNAVYRNDFDPTGKTALADIKAVGDVAPGKQVVERDGSQIQDLDKVPELSTPIQNIETGEKILISEVGGQFALKIPLEEGFRAEVFGGDGEPMRDLDPVEII